MELESFTRECPVCHQPMNVVIPDAAHRSDENVTPAPRDENVTRESR